MLNYTFILATKRSLAVIVTGIVSASLMPVCADGATSLRVCSVSTVSCPYTTISDAVNAAKSGDTITIGQGIFSDHIRLGNKNLHIIGEGSTRTVLQGGPEGPSPPTPRAEAVTCRGGATIFMYGVTIADSINGTGGGILNVDCTITLKRSVIKDNMASGSGGGIFNGGKMRLEMCEIQNNLADIAGGIENTGSLVLVRSHVTNNSASGISYAPALPAGGGIRSLGKLLLIESDVSGNKSNLGGGIAVQSGTTTLVKSAIHANQAIYGNADGGGIWNNGKLTLVDTLFDTNIANHSGGGIFNAANGEIATKINHKSLFDFNKPDDCADTAGAIICP